MATFLGLQVKSPTPLSLLGDFGIAAFLGAIGLLAYSLLGKNPADIVTNPGFYGVLGGMFAGSLSASCGITSPANGFKGKIVMVLGISPLFALTFAGITLGLGYLF